MKETTSQAGKFLTFKLAKEEYGLAIIKVKEIIGMMDITQIPQAREYMKGVINLRGSVIPVIDLRARFEMEIIEATDRTCIVVVEVEKDDSLHPIGVVVDAVSEVLFIKDENIEDTMHFGTNVDNHFITGMAKTENGVKILLDIDKLMSGDDVSEILEAA